MIVRARGVLTMDGAPIEDGAVVTRGETIVDVGPWREVRAHHTGAIDDLGEVLILPGLINAHCHLDYTDLRGAIPSPSSFTRWIRAINERKAAWSEKDYLLSIRHGIDEAAQFGTTTIANLEAFPGLSEHFGDGAMRIWWFAELIDVRKPVSAIEVLQALSATELHGLAPHAPYTASAKLYQETTTLTRRERLVATTHLAESREELEMFRHARGPLFEFMNSLGRPMDDCGTQSSIAWALQRDLLDEHWIVAHLNELTADDFAYLARAPKFHVVHCPRSHAYFTHSPFPFTKLRELGFNICLGTDSLASNDDLSLFAEMRQFARTHPSTNARDVVAMVTTSAAAALGHGESLGRLRGGFCADMIAVPFAGKAGDAFESVVEFDAKVAWRMVSGAVELPR